LVQYYCTDWDFLLSRAEVNGLLVIVEEAKVTVKAPVISSSPQLKVTYGTDLLDFSANIDARTQFSGVTGVSWDIKSQAVQQQEATPKTLNAQGDIDASTLASVIGLSSFRLQTPASIESTALKSWVDAQQIKSGLARIQGRMSFQGSAKAKVGELIELEGVGNRFKGKVFVSSVTHTVDEGNWVTEVEFGMPSNWFADNRDLVAPSASGLLPGIEGLHIGKVMKLDEDPDGQLKIQVSTPVMQAETDGVWARLAHLYASDGFGAFFIPEIGDEVVLGYLNNDPSNPVILGSLYSSTRKLPLPSAVSDASSYALTADNFKKALVTKSKLTLEFDDDKKVITIVTPGKNTIVIDDDDKSILLQDQNKNKIKLSSDGIALDSPKDIVISAKGKISISATGDISMDSKANISETATVGFSAKCANAEISASGVTVVKGSMVKIN
jgi:Rhs element Vgr protein